MFMTFDSMWQAKATRLSPIDHLIEFELLVAHDARVGGASTLVLRGKIIDYLLLESSASSTR